MSSIPNNYSTDEWQDFVSSHHRKRCSLSNTGQRTIHGQDVAQKQKMWRILGRNGHKQSGAWWDCSRNILGSWLQCYVMEVCMAWEWWWWCTTTRKGCSPSICGLLWFCTQKMFLVMAEIIRSKILPVMASQANMGSVRSTCRVRLLPNTAKCSFSHPSKEHFLSRAHKCWTLNIKMVRPDSKRDKMKNVMSKQNNETNDKWRYKRCTWWCWSWLISGSVAVSETKEWRQFHTPTIKAINNTTWVRHRPKSKNIRTTAT